MKLPFPELNTSPHILVMTDEAHRSQYAMLGANLDKGIPNAARIGYTGTPIDKTERVFGDYIDKYTMRQSIEDGVTLEIVYEGRTRGIDEHGNLRSEQTHQFKDSPLGRIPVEWEVGELESVAEFVTSGSRGWAQYYTVHRCSAMMGTQWYVLRM